MRLLLNAGTKVSDIQISRASQQGLTVIADMLKKAKQFPGSKENSIPMPMCELCGNVGHKNPLLPQSYRCGACKTTSYCSAACQKKHWKVHKKVCSK